MKGVSCPQGYDTLAGRIYVMVEARHPTQVVVRAGARTTVLRFPAGRSKQDTPLADGAVSVEVRSGGERRRWVSPLGFGHDNRRLHETMLGLSF